MTVEVKDPHFCCWKDQRAKLILVTGPPVQLWTDHSRSASCVVGALSGLGETEDGVSVKVKLWDMFFMGNQISFLSLLINHLVITT